MPVIKVGGDVNSIAWEGKRVSIWENITVLGRDYSRLWTCWFETPQYDQVQELDWVEIEGELSTKVGEYIPKGQDVPKPVVEHHLNGARIVQVRTKAEQDAQASKWAPAPSGSDDSELAPF